MDIEIQIAHFGVDYSHGQIFRERAFIHCIDPGFYQLLVQCQEYKFLCKTSDPYLRIPTEVGHPASQYFGALICVHPLWKRFNFHLIQV